MVPAVRLEPQFCHEAVFQGTRGGAWTLLKLSWGGCLPFFAEKREGAEIAQGRLGGCAN